MGTQVRVWVPKWVLGYGYQIRYPSTVTYMSIIGFVHVQWNESCMSTEGELSYLFRWNQNENWTLVAKTSLGASTHSGSHGYRAGKSMGTRVRVRVPILGMGTKYGSMHGYEYGYRYPSQYPDTSTIMGTQVPVLSVRVLQCRFGTPARVSVWVQVVVK